MLRAFSSAAYSIFFNSSGAEWIFFYFLLSAEYMIIFDYLPRRLLVTDTASYSTHPLDVDFALNPLCRLRSTSAPTELNKCKRTQTLAIKVQLRLTQKHSYGIKHFIIKCSNSSVHQLSFLNLYYVYLTAPLSMFIVCHARSSTDAQSNLCRNWTFL